MSATYLGMTLSQLEAEGYSIFVVRPLGSVQSALETSSSSSSTVEALAPKQEAPVVEAKPALTERQEMERLRRQRQEERERALQGSSTGSSTTTTPATTDASTKRTRVDHTGEEIGNEPSSKKNKGDLVTTPSFLPRCEVDILAASMPIVDSASQGAPKKEQSFGGSGYRLGGSPPPAAASLPLGFEYEQFGGQGEEDAEWEMMQEAIALSLAGQQK